MTGPSPNTPDISNNRHPSHIPACCDCNIYNTNIQFTAQNKRNNPERKNIGIKGFCYHIGVLIFAPYFSLVKNSSLAECKPFVLQWLVSILLGIKNIEQSKFLNYSSLEIFLDNPVRNLQQQRIKLKEFATKEQIEQILSLNCELVGAHKKTNFYYDPHTKHYTGMHKTLKSWCSKVRIADKLINADYIHTHDGFPVYIQNGDTFEDMRVRFFKDVKEFRRIAKIPDNVIITMNIDRGIFSQDVFTTASALQNIYINTWEKGYENNMWKDNATTKTGTIIKYRNNKSDIKLIKYEYQEYRWSKNNQIRQLIVRVPQKNGIGIMEVSILSMDLLSAATEIIYSMLNRWVQENDFKYLIAHFGIDQITSYDYDNYKDIKDTITDKDHTSGLYKALTKELDSLRGKLKTALHKKHVFDAKFGIYQDISKLINLQDNELIKEFTIGLTKINLEKKTGAPTEKQASIYKKNVALIVGLSEKYNDKFQQRTQTDKLVSKVKELSDNEFKKLNTSAKQFMDAIKIMAHNIFYLGFDAFKEDYNNYRDDHVVFRAFSQSNGIIQHIGSQMQIELVSAMEISPKQIKIFENILDKINSQNIPLLNNQNIKIRIDIPEKINSFFAFVN